MKIENEDTKSWMEEIPVIPHDDWVDLELYHDDAAKSAPAFPAYTFEE